MIRQATVLSGATAAFAGDLRSLLDQLGAPEPEISLALVSELQNVHTEQQLRSFLERYQREILIPMELPAIFQAYHHARRNECRELIALDLRLAEQPSLKNFAAVSQHIGRLHLAHLRPLRDYRFVQRYLDAIEQGQAFGWHTLVYGVMLAVFTLPLHQALVTFANQTLHGFSAAAARARLLDRTVCSEIVNEISQLHPLVVARSFTEIPHVQ